MPMQQLLVPSIFKTLPRMARCWFRKDFYRAGCAGRLTTGYLLLTLCAPAATTPHTATALHSHYPHPAHTRHPPPHHCRTFTRALPCTAFTAPQPAACLRVLHFVATCGWTDPALQCAVAALTSTALLLCTALWWLPHGDLCCHCPLPTSPGLPTHSAFHHFHLHTFPSLLPFIPSPDFLPRHTPPATAHTPTTPTCHTQFHAFTPGWPFHTMQTLTGARALPSRASLLHALHRTPARSTTPWRWRPARTTWLGLPAAAAHTHAPTPLPHLLPHPPPGCLLGLCLSCPFLWDLLAPCCLAALLSATPLYYLTSPTSPTTPTPLAPPTTPTTPHIPHSVGPATTPFLHSLHTLLSSALGSRCPTRRCRPTAPTTTGLTCLPTHTTRHHTPPHCHPHPPPHTVPPPPLPPHTAAPPPPPTHTRIALLCRTPLCTVHHHHHLPWPSVDRLAFPGRPQTDWVSCAVSAWLFHVSPIFRFVLSSLVCCCC